ncbi:hypothetical protein GY45DRAFT_1365496 [Cubamyces sp. BRFM 1775]|nr:hypothetical protein GY45DRAFT_1365496 [Cubamyces sp. BRFM 1775]
MKKRPATVEERREETHFQLADALPPELLDIIFWYASEDKATILACTLVSQNWRGLALPYLFSAVEIAGHRSLGRFNDFSNFINMHPNIARYVRRLELVGVSDTHQDTPYATSLSSLAAVITKLAGLRVLYLREVFFDSEPLSSSSSSFVFPRRLEKLTIDFCNCQCREEELMVFCLPALVGALQTFPADSVSLSYLLVADALPEDHRMALIASTPSLVNVRDLILNRLDTAHRDDYDLGHILDTLRQVLAQGCLRSLQARPYTDSTYSKMAKKSLGVLLRHIGSTLQELALPFLIRLPIPLTEDEPYGWDVIRLHECRNLQSFTIWLYPPELRSSPESPGVYDYDDVPLSTVCIAIMAHLPPTLRIFTLGLCEDSDVEHIMLKEVGLEALDDALSGHRFSSLEKVNIMMGSTRDWDSDAFIDMDVCAQVTRKIMPRCAERGVLEIFEEPVSVGI